MGSTAVSLIILPRPYTLECTQGAVVSTIACTHSTMIVYGSRVGGQSSDGLLYYLDTCFRHPKGFFHFDLALVCRSTCVLFATQRSTCCGIASLYYGQTKLESVFRRYNQFQTLRIQNLVGRYFYHSPHEVPDVGFCWTLLM